MAFNKTDANVEFCIQHEKEFVGNFTSEMWSLYNVWVLIKRTEIIQKYSLINIQTHIFARLRGHTLLISNFSSRSFSISCWVCLYTLFRHFSDVNTSFLSLGFLPIDRKSECPWKHALQQVFALHRHLKATSEMLLFRH